MGTAAGQRGRRRCEPLGSAKQADTRNTGGPWRAAAKAAAANTPGGKPSCDRCGGARGIQGRKGERDNTIRHPAQAQRPSQPPKRIAAGLRRRHCRGGARHSCGGPISAGFWRAPYPQRRRSPPTTQHAAPNSTQAGLHPVAAGLPPIIAEDSAQTQKSRRARPAAASAVAAASREERRLQPPLSRIPPQEGVVLGNPRRPRPTQAKRAVLAQPLLE